MKRFFEWKKEKENRMFVYKCPTCNGEALPGDPESGTMYRGSASCQGCKKSFSVIGLKPIRANGPLSYVKHKLKDGKWVEI